MMKYKPGKNPNLSTSEANQLAKRINFLNKKNYQNIECRIPNDEVALTT